MAVIYVGDDLNFWLSIIFSIANLLWALIVAVYHITSTRNMYGLCSSNVPASIYLSFVLVSLAGIIPMIWITPWFATESQYYCHFAQYVSIPIYSVFKAILYVLLILRSHEAFKNSPLAYDPRKLFILATLLVVVCIFNSAYQIAFSTIDFEVDRTPKCDVVVPHIWFGLIAMLDVIAGIITCYLFTNPLFILYKLPCGADRTKQFILKHTAIKQCILTSIAVATTVITIPLIAVFEVAHVFAGLDIEISTICVVLMYRWNSYIAEKICCAFLCWCVDEEHINNITITISSSNSNIASQTKKSSNIKECESKNSNDSNATPTSVEMVVH